MGDPHHLTQPDQAPHLQTVPDQLTGLKTVPLDAVTPVRVEVLAEEQAESLENEPHQARHADPMHTPGSEPNPTLEALRRSIAAAEERLNSDRELRQQLEVNQEQLRLQQRQLQTLEQERDRLLSELANAHGQLAEVDALQRQLQHLLERNS
jgi:hypothetical protein